MSTAEAADLACYLVSLAHTHTRWNVLTSPCRHVLTPSFCPLRSSALAALCCPLQALGGAGSPVRCDYQHLDRSPANRGVFLLNRDACAAARDPR